MIIAPAARGWNDNSTFDGILLLDQHHANRPRLRKRERPRSNRSIGNESAAADPRTRLPGEMASRASRNAANVSRPAAEPFLVIGEHRLTAPPHRDRAEAISVSRHAAQAAAWLEALPLLNRQRSPFSSVGGSRPASSRALVGR